MRQQTLAVGRDVWRGFFEDDGFVLAGNMAYICLIALFPFLLFLVTLFGAFGQTETGAEAVYTLVNAVPPEVADALRGPLSEVIGGTDKTGLLTLGALLSIWSASTLIEMLRQAILKAYDLPRHAPIRNRLYSALMVVPSCLLMLLAVLAQLGLDAATQFLASWLPRERELATVLNLLRLLVSPVLVFGALFAVFYSLTPRRLRGKRFWPGALATTLLWLVASAALPALLGHFGRYSLTYGSLAGVMAALLFFYWLAFGFVVGAQLNAALGRAALRIAHQQD